MENKNQSENLTTALDQKYTNGDLDFCPPFPNETFEVKMVPAILILVAAGNTLLAISAIISNTLVLVAVRRNNSLRLPSKILLSSLILSDLGTGVSTQPSYAAHFLAKTTDSGDLACFFYRIFTFSISFFSAVSIFTMTAISLDRFTAFFFHLKYKEIVTAKRVSFFLCTSWSCSSMFATSYYWKPDVNRLGTICGLSLCLLTSTTAYTKIYRGLRQHHGHQVQDQAQAQAAATALDVAKYRRTTSSMLWICGLFLSCYLPHLCILLMNRFLPYSFPIIVTTTLMFLNSSLNPLVCYLHLPEIRAEVIRTVRQILRQSN